MPESFGVPLRSYRATILVRLWAEDAADAHGILGACQALIEDTVADVKLGSIYPDEPPTQPDEDGQ